MSATLRVVARLTGGAVILGALAWRLGTGPFLDGVRAISGWSIVLAALICLATTACAAWRWTLVARGLGVALPLPGAVAACYRAQFLNTILPGGVLGDVHRGVRHGKAAGDLSKALRAVVWERTAGQVVQILITVLALCVLPSPLRSHMALILAAGVVAALLIFAALRAVARSRANRIAGWVRVAGADIRHGVVARRAWPGIVLASVLVVIGHVATFVIAADAVGTKASVGQLVPIALLALLAMAVPLNVGGWGPREGVAAWAFAAAGFGAAQGVAVATAFGVLVMAATLPGGALLLRTDRRPKHARPQPGPAVDARCTAVTAAGAARG